MNIKNIYRENFVDIDLNAIAHNVLVIKKAVHPAKVMAIVKADGYGHGIYETSLVALNSGAEALGVAIPEEGVALRERGILSPILVLGGTSKAGCEAAVEYGLTQTVFSCETVHYLQEAAKRTGNTVDVHIKIDSGMNRIGIKTKSELNSLIELINTSPNVVLKAAFTHFACAEDNEVATAAQNDCFLDMIACLRQEGFTGYLHAANSAAALRYKWARYDYVRPGIAIYGVNPVNKFVPLDTNDGLIQAMTWKTRIAHVKYVAEGESISYGYRFKATRNMKVATLMVGYGDGYKRLCGSDEEGASRGYVLISGCRAPVLGRICMDQMMVDISDITDIQTGDEAVLLGGQGNEFITADELASWADTISYEALLSISQRVPRVYTQYPY